MDTASALEILRKGLHILGLVFTEKEIQQFDRYILSLEGCIHNLTSIRGPENIVKDHFLDSLSVLKFFKPQEDGIYADIGSGAGFPLMPIKILNPGLKAVFIDSKQKSAEFIETISRDFSFPKGTCRVINSHTTELRRQGMKGCFDEVFVRALGNIGYIIENCLSLIKKGGILWMYKGPKYEEELSLLPRPNRKQLKKIDILDVSVPFLDKKRFILKAVKA